ncbi:type 4a pilus biogenesis protein PilO [Anaerovibrio sp. RM50]|uniref:type 4a pilus biogenesis protein PilO n=1 Tax=Anaerovibrio sp. RM50 TaxID=1200557 RepID=UPI000486A8E5|nr:type 4a pilus biogenesis protein PilO [Anaerovibrio sp. RM50]
MWNLFARGSYRLVPVKIYIGGVAVVLGLFIILLNIFIILPQSLHKIEENENTLHSLKNQVEDINSFQNANGDIEVYFARLTKEYQRIDRLLPDNESISGFIDIIQRQSEEKGLELISMKPGKAIRGDKCTEQPIELGLRGGYFQIMDFFKTMQQDSRYTKTNSLSIKYSPQGLECHINVSIFYLLGGK